MGRWCAAFFVNFSLLDLLRPKGARRITDRAHLRGARSIRPRSGQRGLHWPLVFDQLKIVVLNTAHGTLDHCAIGQPDTSAGKTRCLGSTAAAKQMLGLSGDFRGS